jgi:uncharacterized protein (DUF2336 family)
MRAPISLISELEDVVQRGSRDKCAEVLRKVTDLFLATELCEDESVALYDEIMGRLIVHIEARVLAELSERLAPIDYAPPNTICQLARSEEIAVAGPVLKQSPRISDSVLLEIAKSSSQAHLLAISSRRGLVEPVTDVLVDRGNMDVARNVAANPGARLSESTFTTLAHRAEADEDLAESIVRRPEIPLHIFCALLARASDLVRDRLFAATPPESHLHVRSTVNRISGEVAAAAPTPCNYAIALRSILLTHAQGELREHEVLELARAGRFEEAVAALSLFSAAPIELVDQVMCGDRVEPVLVLCKAARLQWPTVRAFLQIRQRGWVAPDRLFDLSFDFARLSHTTARKVLRFWENRRNGEEIQ